MNEITLIIRRNYVRNRMQSKWKKKKSEKVKRKRNTSREKVYKTISKPKKLGAWNTCNY